MKVFILPGYSIKNKEWAYDVKSKLMPDFDVEVYEWKHWTEENADFDVGSEVVSIIDFTKSEDKLDIIAKSIGSLVAVKLLDVLKDKIGKLIFCGIPLNDLKEEDFSAYKVLDGVPHPENIICFQNSADPHGNYQQVFAFLDNINPRIKIIDKGSNTHDYPYFEDYIKFLKN